MEFESSQEGDFVKICLNEHKLGVEAEYVWIKKMYQNAFIIKQRKTNIILNGENIDCDILYLDVEKKIYFDISQMMENLNNIISGKTNRNLWDKKAMIIYDKLINEYNFSICNNDEEALYKEINKNTGLGFDVQYYFGFVIRNNNEMKNERSKCKLILEEFVKNNFIGNIIIENEIMGGYIKIDEIDDINQVYINYKKIEEEYIKQKNAAYLECHEPKL
jgi:hypothetical protein